jgi:hypothetical protein
MTDVAELIVAEHRRIGRLSAALDHAVSHPSRLYPDPARLVWARLAELVLLHADAEQEICFPAMFAHAGPGGEEIRQATADLDELRAAVAQGNRHRPDSPQWQAAVLAVGRAAHKHSVSIEHGALPALCRGTSPRQRAQLGRRWAGFITAHLPAAS